MAPARILILGGGILGLSSAKFIQDQWSLDERTSKRSLHITIITENMTPHTTGDVAGGIWTPSAIDDPDHEKIKYIVFSLLIFYILLYIILFIIGVGPQLLTNGFLNLYQTLMEDRMHFGFNKLRRFGCSQMIEKYLSFMIFCIGYAP